MQFKSVNCFNGGYDVDIFKVMTLPYSNFLSYITCCFRLNDCFIYKAWKVSSTNIISSIRRHSTFSSRILFGNYKQFCMPFKLHPREQFVFKFLCEN